MSLSVLLGVIPLVFARFVEVPVCIEVATWSCSDSVDTYPLGEEEESTMPKSRPPYPAAFRQQMVELVRSGRTPGELAREFEPSAEAIRNWVAQTDRDAGKRSDGLRTEEHEEIRRLRRENRQLREASTRFFSCGLSISPADGTVCSGWP